jgi:hypothetical protein
MNYCDTSFILFQKLDFLLFTTRSRAFDLPTPRQGDGTDAICSGHGTCDGDGWRGGTGKCKCDYGWGGKQCDACKKGFFVKGATDRYEQSVAML